MRPPFTPPLRDLALVTFWLGVKIGVGLVIGAALFGTVGLVAGLQPCEAIAWRRIVPLPFVRQRIVLRSVCETPAWIQRGQCCR